MYSVPARIAWALAVVVSMMAAGAGSDAQQKTQVPPALRGVKRILFLGDSITYAGGYVDYVQAAMMAQGVGKDIEVIDAGLPSETVSGLSEPGHAGGAFPRPCLLERLDRVLNATHPDLVFACYGMNDGIYYPLAEDRFDAYKKGYETLAAAVKHAGARFVAVTPPPFDASALGGNTLPAGRAAYPLPFEGYDSVLGAYSNWLLSQRAHGWNVIDIHGPLNASLTRIRMSIPNYHFAGDGVHMNAYGHWLAAREIIGHLQIGPLHHRVQVKADAAVGVWSTHTQLSTSIPVPEDAGMSAEELLQSRMDLGTLHLTLPRGALKPAELVQVTTRIIGLPEEIVTATPLADNRTLTLAIGQIDKARGKRLMADVHAMRQMLTDAWLTKTGHKRPGMAKGVSIDDAGAVEKEIRARLVELLQPVELTITVKAPR